MPPDGRAGTFRRGLPAGAGRGGEQGSALCLAPAVSVPWAPWWPPRSGTRPASLLPGRGRPGPGPAPLRPEPRVEPHERQRPSFASSHGFVLTLVSNILCTTFVRHRSRALWLPRSPLPRPPPPCTRERGEVCRRPVVGAGLFTMAPCVGPRPGRSRPDPHGPGWTDGGTRVWRGGWARRCLTDRRGPGLGAGGVGLVPAAVPENPR